MDFILDMWNKEQIMRQILSITVINNNRTYLEKRQDDRGLKYDLVFCSIDRDDWSGSGLDIMLWPGPLITIRLNR